MHKQDQANQAIKTPIRFDVQLSAKPQKQQFAIAEQSEHDAIVGIEAFEQIYQCYRQFVTRCICHTLSYNHRDIQVEDLMQETFLRAFKSLQEGKTLPAVAIPGWLARIATNLTIDLLRRQSHATLVPFTATPRLSLTQNADLINEIQSLLADCKVPFEQRLAMRESIKCVLRKMSRTSAVCLWHYEHEGLSCAEIAQLLHMNVPAVRVCLKRARASFKKLYRSEQ